MITFKPAAPDVRVLDPLKRVNYSFGLVLGVDEFLQEQTHLLEKHRRHNRTLHDSGTVWGLKVWVPTTVSPVEVRVEPGLAVSPSGHEICVPRVMCAPLDDWLAANRDSLDAVFGPPPFDLSLCVVLCYRECTTDIVPLPGEPCRSADETMAPSRVAESFKISLCAHDSMLGSPPDDVLCSCPVHGARAAGRRALGALLRRIEVTSLSPTIATPMDVEAEVRKLADLDSLSPPSSGPILTVQPQDLHDVMQGAARVWATEVLPALMRRDGDDSCGAGGDRCVLLAELHMKVSAINTVVGGASGVVVDDTERPILLATGVMQEWLLSGGPVPVVVP